jgi:hypothetical protein
MLVSDILGTDVLTLRKLHDTGDVDGGRVAVAEYIILLTWDSEASKFLQEFFKILAYIF